MKNNLLASIALFGIYRNKNLDTYDLVAQYISAVIAQKQYNTFKPDTMQSDLKELYQIDIPIGVIRSVCRNRIEGVSLKNKEFICDLLPKDEIEKEYADLKVGYEELFASLIDFIRRDTKDYEDQTIKDSFADYLVEGSIDDTKLNNLYAAFFSSNQSDKDTRQKIDLLSSGLISYNGLSYTDSAGNSGAWTDKLTIYLDTEFLFSCAGYNDSYPHAVFEELYNLVKEINTSYRRRTKKEDNLVELKYLKDTRDVYLSLINTAKSLKETNGMPDPSKKALLKIMNESASVFEVDTHRAKIDSAIKDTYHIIYDDRDYSNIITDPRYVVYDEKTVTSISGTYNPQKDGNTTRKIDYYSRVYTIINGLRNGKNVCIFEQCRYIFLTGSRIGHGTSQAARPDKKTVSFATDIDFLISRFWFKLNKQLVTNQIPVSLDIVARSQAVLTREVSRKVKHLYEEMKLKGLSKEELQSLYANLTEAERFFAPYNSTSTEVVLSFIGISDIDEMIKEQKELKQKAAEAEKISKDLAEATGQLAQKDDEIAGLKKESADRDEKHEREKADKQAQNDNLTRKNKWQRVTIIVLLIALILVLLFK
uniref:hypothetical protein n=1 Tax=Candidatus Cryptobacteroides bacterium TaxID=3085639 RepID=UPI004026BFFC